MMRVISQNGLIDVPYEMTAFHVVGEDVRMNMVGDTGKGSIMAQYSSQEKAFASVAMLREAYMDCNAIYDKYEDGHGTVVTTGFVQNGIFRFPADDEVQP